MDFTAWLLHTTCYNQESDKQDGVFKFACLVDRDIRWPFPDTLEDMQKYLEEQKEKEGTVWHNHEGLAFMSRVAWDDYTKGKSSVVTP